MALLSTFSSLKLRLILKLLAEKKNFPGITEEFLVDFRTWLNDEENFDWLLKLRSAWEADKEFEDIEDPMDRLDPVEKPDPEPTDPVDIDKEYPYYEKWEHLRFIHNRAFTWLRPGYKGKIKFVWPELNHEFIVPDGSKDYRNPDHSQEAYWCGTNNKPEESNGTKASIFGPGGKVATYVEVHFSEK